MSIKLIVGLGNPGAAYERTRHNAGFWFVEALARQHHVSLKLDKKLQGFLVSTTIDNNACQLLMPANFMNLSGQSVRAVCQFYRILPNEILVAHDDLDLPAGRIKLKTGGGHGGHNGLRDIIAQLGSPEFHRLRVGIAHPGHRDLVLNYVLGAPSQHDRQLMVEAIDRAVSVIPTVLAGNLPIAMGLLNG